MDLEKEWKDKKTNWLTDWLTDWLKKLTKQWTEKDEKTNWLNNLLLHMKSWSHLMVSNNNFLHNKVLFITVHHIV